MEGSPQVITLERWTEARLQRHFVFLRHWDSGVSGSIEGFHLLYLEKCSLVELGTQAWTIYFQEEGKINFID